MAKRVAPRSLVWATDIDVLPVDHEVLRREGYLAVRSPSNPTHYWGNLLLFDAPPGVGDGERWERSFDAEFADEPSVAHRTFGWEGVEGELGEAAAEFVARGYELIQTVGLVATPRQIHPNPRESRTVVVRALEPGPGADDELWEQVVELQVAARDESFDEEAHRAFSRRRLEDLRAVFRLGRGAWYVALDGPAGEVVASCGVVVTGGVARFQTVDTAAAHRRRGICSRLLVEAVGHATAHHGAKRFVIAADPGYHALGIYQSLGFRRREHVSGVCLRPQAPGRATAGGAESASGR